MKNILKYSFIIMPSIICALLIYVFKFEIVYYPLSFGLIIGLMNWKEHKFNTFVGILLSVLLSYLAFYIAYFSFAGLGFLFDSIRLFKNSENTGILFITISTMIIAPILVYYVFNFIFNFQKSKTTFYIKLFSIIFLIFYSLMFNKINNKFSIYDFGNILNIYTIWQIIMALSIQIMLFLKHRSYNNQKV